MVLKLTPRVGTLRGGGFKTNYFPENYQLVKPVGYAGRVLQPNNYGGNMAKSIATPSEMLQPNNYGGNMAKSIATPSEMRISNNKKTKKKASL